MFRFNRSPSIVCTVDEGAVVVERDEEEAFRFNKSPSIVCTEDTGVVEEEEEETLIDELSLLVLPRRRFRCGRGSYCLPNRKKSILSRFRLFCKFQFDTRLLDYPLTTSSPLDITRSEWIILVLAIDVWYIVLNPKLDNR